MPEGILLQLAGTAIQQGTQGTAASDHESTVLLFVGKSWREYGQRSVTACRAWPNPSLKRSANGRPPGPGRWYSVHFHRPGPGVRPLSPA
jgi:hypothetical protein